MINKFLESLLSSIIFFSDFSSKNNFQVESNFGFTIKNHKYNFDGLLKKDVRKIGLEIPTLSSFDKPCGTAAYYAATRLLDAISSRVITEGILITTRNTKGNRLDSVVEIANNKIFVQEFNQRSANSIVEYQRRHEIPPIEAYNIAKFIFNDIIEYENIK